MAEAFWLAMAGGVFLLLAGFILLARRWLNKPVPCGRCGALAKQGGYYEPFGGVCAACAQAVRVEKGGIP